MNVKLTHHAEELITAMRAKSGEPVERIIEHALELLVREERIEVGEVKPYANQREAVREALDFFKRNRVHLGPGLSAKDLIHEGHRV